MKEEGVFNHNFENAERIGYLIANYVKGTLTPLERKELDDWILQSEANELLFDELTSEENIEKTMQWYAAIDEEKARQRLSKRINFKREKRRSFFPALAVAASVTVIVGFAIFLLWQKKKGGEIQSQPIANSMEIYPAKDKPFLTLANGTKIMLDSTAPKWIEGNGIKIEEGTISYETSSTATTQENLLTVPKGAQYTVILSDGTKVWLNAESSLRYVTSFVSNERRVALTGEGYFEVAKNKEKPFIVESSGNSIKVLGTKFNINSYGDENAFIATLVEGAVQISRGSISKLMKPGEEARVVEDKINLAATNTYEAIAWKEGEFVFRNASVHSVVSQLARWYNLEPEFKEPVDKHLNATIKRNEPLSKVLHYLEQTGDVHFKMEGRKLIVTK